MTGIDRLYTIEEAANALRMSHWGLRRWVKHGKLNCVRLSRNKILIRESELKRMIEDDPPKSMAANA